MTGYNEGLPDGVSIDRARTPFKHRVVSHADEPTRPSIDRDVEGALDLRRLEVVIHDRNSLAGERRIEIADVTAGPWPYCETWGEGLTVDEASRLAEMLLAAVHTLAVETEGART